MSSSPSLPRFIAESGRASVTSCSSTSQPNICASARTNLRVVYVALKYTNVIFFISILYVFMYVTAGVMSDVFMAVCKTCGL